MFRKTILSLAVLLSLFCSVADAMRLDSSGITLLTADANAAPSGWTNSFDICRPQRTVVWSDLRETSGTPSIYGVELDDILLKEFVIDPCAVNGYYLSGADHLVAFSAYYPSGSEALRFIDITDTNNPIPYEQSFTYLGNCEISGTYIAFSLTDPITWSQSIWVLDASDPANTNLHLIESLGTNESLYYLTMDGFTLAYSIYNWDSGSCVRVADISDVNKPVFKTAILPLEIQVWDIDTSGDWLVFDGQAGYRRIIGAVQNYKDCNDWNILTLWRSGDEEQEIVSPPRIDGNIAVWITSTHMPSAAGPSAQSEPEWFIKGALLLDNGNFTCSTLRRNTSRKDAAEILGSTVVWSEESSRMDLLSGNLVFECGDWGYEYGDLNWDCRVDFLDFAIFAESWLRCTLPGGSGCGYGPLRKFE